MNRKHLINFALTIALLPLFLAANLNAQNGTFSGTVVDVETGSPLVRAVLEISGGGVTQNTQTDASGRFSVSLSAGRYSAFLTAIGYAPMRIDGMSPVFTPS